MCKKGKSLWEGFSKPFGVVLTLIPLNLLEFYTDFFDRPIRPMPNTRTSHLCLLARIFWSKYLWLGGKWKSELFENPT